MQMNPVAIAKIGGAAAALALIVLAVVWVQADYTIKGTAAIDTGLGMRPASQVEVRLIDSAVSQEIGQYVAEYEALKKDLVRESAEKLYGRLARPGPQEELQEPEEADRDVSLTIENLVNGSAPLDEEALQSEHPEVQRIVRELNRVLEPLTDEERTQVTVRVQRYLDYALYCRERSADIRAGDAYYELAAQYWEDRAERLKEMGRLLVDDAEPSYETSWLPYAGLGEEPSQKVRTVVRADKRAQLGVIEQARADAGRSVDPESAAGTEQRTDAPTVEEGGVIAGAPVTTNEILDAIVGIQQRLRQQYVTMLKRSDEKLLALTVEQVTTDDDGQFEFTGDQIQPGDFLVFARYDMLTTDGEQVEFMWYEPVTISLRRYAFDKTTEVALDELNQRRPACLEVAEPTRDELLNEVVKALRAEQQHLARGG